MCYHRRSLELFNISISQPDQCWGHFSCQGETERRGCTVDNLCSSPTLSSEEREEEPVRAGVACRSEPSPGLHFGYWWDGREGDYGVLLDRIRCYQCLEDAQCSPGSFCDVLEHVCVEQGLDNDNSTTTVAEIKIL